MGRENLTHIYTKAEKETDVDCFGRLHNRNSIDCQICVVARSCQRSLTASVSFGTTVEPTEQRKEIAVKSKKKKKSKNPTTTSTSTSMSVGDYIARAVKNYKKDKENAGFRPMSAGWVCFQALQNASFKKGKVFSTEKYCAAVKLFSKNLKVKVNIDAKAPRMLWIFKGMGLIEKVSKGKFKRIA